MTDGVEGSDMNTSGCRPRERLQAEAHVLSCLPCGRDDQNILCGHTLGEQLPHTRRQHLQQRGLFCSQRGPPTLEVDDLASPIWQAVPCDHASCWCINPLLLFPLTLAQLCTQKAGHVQAFVCSISRDTYPPSKPTHW